MRLLILLLALSPACVQVGSTRSGSGPFFHRGGLPARNPATGCASA